MTPSPTCKLRSWASLLLLLIGSGSLFAQTETKIYFEPNGRSLDQTGIEEISSILDDLLKDPDQYVFVKGHTDKTGPAEQNMALSFDRAKVIASYLRTKGIDDERILVSGVGESTSSTPGRYASVSLVDELPSQKVEPLSQLFQERDRNGHSFTFDANSGERQVFNGDQGTVLAFSSDIFELDGVPVSGKVTVRLNEFYNTANMLKADLSTSTTDGRLLETGGMVEICAFDEDGNELSIAEGRSMSVGFRGRSNDDRMQLFNARVDTGAAGHGQMNWQESALEDTDNTSENDPIYRVERVWPDSIVTSAYHKNDSMYLMRGLAFDGEMFPLDTLCMSQDDGFLVNSKVLEGRSVLLRKQYHWTRGNFSQLDTLDISEYVRTDTIEVIGNDLLMNTSELGWINCDRFIGTETTKLMVNFDPGKTPPTVRLILNGISSILRPDYRCGDNSYCFNAVPQNADVTVFGVRRAPDGKNVEQQLLETTLGAGRRTIVGLDLKTSTEQELENALTALDKTVF